MATYNKRDVRARLRELLAYVVQESCAMEGCKEPLEVDALRARTKAMGNLLEQLIQETPKQRLLELVKSNDLETLQGNVISEKWDYLP